MTRVAPGPGAAIDWDMAHRVALRFSRRQPFTDSAMQADLESSYMVATAQAEKHVAAETGLISSFGPARAVVTDRPGWIDANLASFQRLLRPLTDRFEAEEASRWQAVGSKASGAQLGALLGWMSTKVLGQYDLLVVEDETRADQDMVYYVGPNLASLERRYAFPAEQFRLWVALHECTHRAQFTGVSWLREYFIGQVHLLLGSINPDPGHLLKVLKRSAAELRSGVRPLDRGGLAAVLATPEQRQVLDRLAGLMSLLEGHGEVVMNRAGAARVPSAWRFEKVLKSRREAAGGLSRLFNRLVGLEAKMNQYAEGEHFIQVVEAHGGRALFDTVWRGPQWLPTLPEIRAPRQWVERVDQLERHA